MTQREAYQSLMSGRCHCKRPKSGGNAFCRDCYYSLPWPMRKALFQRIGRGFEAAYEAAAKYIQQERSAA